MLPDQSQRRDLLILLLSDQLHFIGMGCVSIAKCNTKIRIPKSVVNFYWINFNDLETMAVIQITIMGIGIKMSRRPNENHFRKKNLREFTKKQFYKVSFDCIKIVLTKCFISVLKNGSQNQEVLA